VVEPEDIVAADERGHRLLFIALTRTTRYLDIVAVGDPLPLARPAPVPPQRRDPDGPAADDGQLDRLAGQIVATVTAGAPATAWYEVLNRAAAILERQGEPGGSSGATGRHRRG
jgi:hypothetical protein